MGVPPEGECPLLKRFTASMIAASMLLAPALATSGFAQTTPAPAPAGSEAQPAQPASPTPKMAKKKPANTKMAAKKPAKKGGKGKAPAGDQGQDPPEQQ